ncbi:uncharacterized protein BDR25DRAFT_392204 [Lindgomyces ingoldianus]|uniref:Uncharacterized protein n=1 Tax=Lindgomyces ingoldianus TaxID=673940 RepID=A0ACB6R3B5_9PLEO|nr:uncharacterized protein BDR25DRAFT_392204 [Lindgomyces ingoldianus]KAF2473744.1 hypothetical protein BDR25DRAFT_392204 [Lindgomyces ingoldianus]
MQTQDIKQCRLTKLDAVKYVELGTSGGHHVACSPNAAYSIHRCSLTITESGEEGNWNFAVSVWLSYRLADSGDRLARHSARLSNAAIKHASTFAPNERFHFCHSALNLFPIYASASDTATRHASPSQPGREKLRSFPITYKPSLLEHARDFPCFQVPGWVGIISSVLMKLHFCKFTSFMEQSKHTPVPPVTVSAQVLDLNSSPPQRAPDSVHRANWHREVKACRPLHEYLATGQNLDILSSLEMVKTITRDYLYQQESVALQSPECDALLNLLIREHAFADHSQRDIAVASCLHVLSISAAHRHFTYCLQNNVQRYIRLLVLAQRINTDFLPPDTISFVQSLSWLTSGNGSPLEDLQNFRQVIEKIGTTDVWELTPVTMVQKLLTNTDCSSRIQGHVQDLLQSHRYLSAIKALAWLKSVQSFPNNQDAGAMLDEVLPGWHYLRLWEPKISRITQFEQGNFSEQQSQKLVHILTLEGPDTITWQKPSLAKVDLGHRQNPACRLSSTEAECILDLLYSCQRLGTNAIDLFICLCVDDTLEEYEFGPDFVKDAIAIGDDICCLNARILIEGAQDGVTVSQRLSSFTKALPAVKSLGPHWFDRPPLIQAFGRVETTMSKAQEAFHKSLETGSGRHMGMLIHGYGDAILKAPFVHVTLSGQFLSKLRQFPTRDTLMAVFERIRKSSSQIPIENCRFKSYLASALGGRLLVLDHSITMAAIQNEIKFWKHPPDTARKDLARALEKVKTVRYSLYTSWLLVILREDDQFIGEVKHIMMGEMEQRVLRLANYLAIRRKFNQMRDETWLLLFASLIEDRGPTYLQKMADSMPVTGFEELISNLSKLVESVRGSLPQFGAGLTQEQLDWWETLSQRRDALQTLFGNRGQTMNPKWLYFPPSPRKIIGLLDALGAANTSHSIYTQVLPFLSQNGDNILDLCDCIESLKTTSAFGQDIFKRQITRYQNKGDKKLPGGILKAIIQIWTREGSQLTSPDRLALAFLEKLLQLPTSFPPSALHTLRQLFEADHNELMERARSLEKLRLQLHQSNSNRVAAILRRLQIENTSPGRATQGNIPEEIADAVEAIGEEEYEISFPLTGLNDVQRAAKGISPNSRLLLVRLSIRSGTRANGPTFCIHFSPNEEGGHTHGPWAIKDATLPNGAICTTRPTLFTYHLGRIIHKMLSTSPIRLPAIYSCVASLVSSAPDTCLVCTQGMGIRLWKPSACSRNCSLVLRAAPLEVRLHNMLINPKAIDLLLTSIYAASSESQSMQLLPYCPVALPSIKAVIDSMPMLDGLQTASDLRTAIRGSDTYGKNREDLLSWLCMRFRGFMLSVPDGFKVPSLGVNTEQFLIVNSNHEREKGFNAHYTSGGGSTVVFHGTRASRLFPILIDGLRIARNGNLRLNGAAYGEGIYCGNDMQTSWGFSGTTGQSWRNSTLKNMNVMLGCELAPATPGTHGSIHVVTDENRLLGRYVFLLPQTFRPPIRSHVEPAMMTGFAKLRSGLQA